MNLQDMWATLQTFSLTEDSFPMIIENVALLLRTLTIKIYKNDDKGSSWFSYVLLIVGGTCYFYFYIFNMLWLVFVHYSMAEDFVAMTLAISLAACSFSSNFYFMKLHESDIRDIIENFLAFDAQLVTGSRFTINLRKNLRVVKKRALIIWIFLVTDAAIYNIIPFLRPGRHFTEDLYILYGLEPMLESPNYEISHILNTISIAYCVYTTVNIAVYVVVIIGYNEAQIYAISEEVRNLWNDAQNFYSKIKHKIRNKIHTIYLKEKIVNEYMRIRLKTIVYHHVTNVNLFKELNQQFSDTLAIEYSIMCVAIIAELLGGLENTYLQVPYTFVQISMDCLSGQRLIDACHELENALYICEWENFNVSNQKTILLMMLIAQKTLMLSAGGMADLNFSCLMIILKSSYSAYTALKSSIQH